MPEIKAIPFQGQVRAGFRVHFVIAVRLGDFVDAVTRHGGVRCVRKIAHATRGCRGVSFDETPQIGFSIEIRPNALVAYPEVAG